MNQTNLIKNATKGKIEVKTTHQNDCYLTINDNVIATIETVGCDKEVQVGNALKLAKLWNDNLKAKKKN